MNLIPEIQAAKSDPQRLEQLFQQAQERDQTGVFLSALLACYEETPDNLLYAAWFYRLHQTAPQPEKIRRGVNWILAVPLSILTGLLFWLLSDFQDLMIYDHLPHLVLWWSPLATMSALAFLVVTARKNYQRAAILALGLLAAGAYVLLLAPGLGASWKVNHYLDLGAIHIPLLSWIALGAAVLGFKSSKEARFAFLIKSIEVMITAGLYLIAGVVFGVITVGMFDALSITLPELWMRLIMAGGFGLLPVLAVASVYDPTLSPLDQDFNQGLSKFIATMMRLLLPLTLGVLAIYILVIPFNFLEPYQNRDVLIVYNLMLFGIMGLLLGATPMRGSDLSPQLQKWLRNGILAVAILAELVSLYALSATVYRTVDGGWTINRLTIIGWNMVNIAILFWLIYKQWKTPRERWVPALQSVFSLATNAYLVWGLIVVVVIPWLFR